MVRFAVCFIAALAASVAASTLEVPATATDAASAAVSAIAEPALLTQERAEEFIRKGYTIKEITPEQASRIAAGEVIADDAKEFRIEKPAVTLSEQAALESSPVFSSESSKFIPSEFPMEKSFRMRESSPIYSGESSKFIPSDFSIEKPSFRVSESSRIIPDEFPIDKSFRMRESSPIFSGESSRFVPSSYSIDEPSFKRWDDLSASKFIERPSAGLSEPAFDGARIIPSGYSIDAPSRRNWEYSAPRYALDDSALRSDSRIVEKPSFQVSESSPIFSSDSSRFFPSSYSFEEPTFRGLDSSKIIRKSRDIGY